MKNNRIYSIDVLIDHYDVILPDTCVISACTKTFKTRDNIKKKAMNSKIQYLSYGFWEKVISNNKKNNILFVPEIVAELKKVKEVKFKSNPQGIYRRRAFKKFALNTAEAVIKGKSLIEKIKNLGLILNLNEEDTEKYEAFYGIFKHLQEERCLLGADYPLTMKSMVVALSGEKTALISNDYGIFDCWKSLLKFRDLELRGKLDFFFRNEFNGFYKINFYNKKKQPS